MSDDFGRHHFLAWAREGIASLLKNPDYGSSLPDRGALEVAPVYINRRTTHHVPPYDLLQIVKQVGKSVGAARIEWKDRLQMRRLQLGRHELLGAET